MSVEEAGGEGVEGGEGVVLGAEGLDLLFERGFVVAEEEADYVAPGDFDGSVGAQPLSYHLEYGLDHTRKLYVGDALFQAPGIFIGIRADYESFFLGCLNETFKHLDCLTCA